MHLLELRLHPIIGAPSDPNQSDYGVLPPGGASVEAATGSKRELLHAPTAGVCCFQAVSSQATYERRNSVKLHDDIVYKDKYIWHRGKNILNQRNHHISFETASNVFDDPFAFELFDEANSLDEDRYKVTGYIHGISYVTVSVTYRDPLIRLFSARTAEPNEIEEYNENAERYLG